MRALISIPLLTLFLAACGGPSATERPPYLPPSVFGTYQDNDVGGINLAAWAFASPKNIKGDPVDAAKAMVALEYLSTELKEPRWASMDASIPHHMANARDQLRQILGIRPDAPSQAVINALLAIIGDLQAGNQPTVMQVLASPIFTKPPAEGLQILSNLPYVQEANLSSSRAQDQEFPPGGPHG
jgi:hypothetical protein